MKVTDGMGAPTCGSVFAVGGREAREGTLVVLERFVALCGGPAARLVLILTASDEPEERIGRYDHAFRTLGVTDLSFFHPTTGTEAAGSDLLAALERADGVFFCGGSQLKLVSTLGGTLFEARLRTRHAQGLHIGGSSAGASAMSAVMITGGKSGSTARRGSVAMTPGFGFLSKIIVDQHFTERDRFGRLFAAVLCNPSMLGLGLDEDTAFAFDADHRLRVHGNGTLTIVDASSLEANGISAVPATAPAAFAGMRVHALTDGWTYDVAQRRVGQPPIVNRPPDSAGDR